MASLSTVIQGLLVAQLPEYEISNDAIGFLSNFSEKLLVRLVNEESHPSLSAAEVKAAIQSTFPSDWASLILSSAVAVPHAEEKDSSFKQEISDFEFIEDGPATPEIERRAVGNLLISADFIKSFVSPAIASRLDSDGCKYLAVSIESVLSKLIQLAPAALKQHKDEDPMVITQRALEEAIQADPQMAQLANVLNQIDKREDAPAEMIPGFEPIEDETLGDEEDDSDVRESDKPVELTHEESVQVAEEPEKISEAIHGAEKVTSEKHEDAESRTEVLTEQTQELLPTQVEEQESFFVPSTDEIAEDTNKSSAEPSVELEEKEGESKALPRVEVSESTPLETSSDQQLPVADLYLPAASQSDVAMVKKPVVELYGRCCPYFDMTTFAIHMLSSIMELFIRHVIGETSRIAHPHARVLKQHAREAVRRLTTFQSQMLDEIARSDGNLFNECVNASVKIIPRKPEWDTEMESYIAEVVLYVSSRILLVASAHARMAGQWIIGSNDIASASLQVVTTPSPISKLIQQLTDYTKTEGPVISPPPAPRIRAAEMIYLSSIINETPLQLDNQLLVIFLFLVTLSIHTLCCVR